MITLTIDTTTQVLGVALFKNDQFIKELTKETRNNHGSFLMPTIEELLSDTEVKVTDLERIVVAHGPGSYTGTRIGVTTAKTLAWSLNIPVFTISSLTALSAYGQPDGQLFCTMIDARRKSVYAGVYRWIDGKLKCEMEEQHITIDSLLAKFGANEVVFISPDAENLQDSFPKSSYFVEDVKQSPCHLYLKDEWITHEDVHHVTPNYLRMTEAERNLLQKQKGAE